MTAWAVGDIQGCAEPLLRLLDTVNFDTSEDTLWVAGDMVNRGPDNLSVLRLLKSLGANAKVVLGNHDLHLLAASVGARKLSQKDTLHDVINAVDAKELLEWLKQQPLVQSSEQYIMAHAGIPHIWTDDEAIAYAAEVATWLQNTNTCTAFLMQMYGNTPDCWSADLESFDRLRTITNYFTRMRFITPSGQLDFTSKESLSQSPVGYVPWFILPRPQPQKEIIFGHWAALNGHINTKGIHALDTGCVWGGKLTLMNLATQQRVSVSAQPTHTMTL